MVTYGKKVFDSSPILSSIISQRFLVGEQWLIPFIPGSFRSSVFINSSPGSSGFIYCLFKAALPLVCREKVEYTGTAATEPLSVPVSWFGSCAELDSSIEGASRMWMANGVYAYIQGNLGREIVNVTLQFKHLLGTAGKWDTKESKGLFSVFWGVLDNRQEEFGILLSLETLISAVSGVQKEKRWQTKAKILPPGFLYSVENLILIALLVFTLSFPCVWGADMSSTSMFNADKSRSLET